MFRILLRTRRRVWFNKYIRGRWQARLGLIIGLITGLAIATGSYFIGRAVFSAVIHFEGPETVISALTTVLTGFLLFLLLTGITVAFYSLFASPELNILLAAPIPLPSVFLLKFLDVFLGISVTFTFFLLPALMGLGPVLKTGSLYYPAVLAAALGYLAIPTGLAMLVIMVLIRLIPAERAKEVFGALGALVSALAYFFSQFALTSSGQKVVNRDNMANLLGKVDLPWSPGTWLAQFVVSVGRGQYGDALVPGILLAVSALAVFAVSFVLVEKIYISGWTAGAGVPSGRSKIKEVCRNKKGSKGNKGSKGITSTGGFSLLPQGLRAILVKDMKTFSRDLQELVQLLMPITVVLILVLRQKADMANQPGLTNPGSMEVLGIMGVLVMVMSMFSSRLSLTAVAREGRSIWILNTAPLPWVRILLGKLLASFIFPVLIAEILFIAATLYMGFPPTLIFIGALALVAIMLGVTAIGLLVGSVYPKFDAENPKQMLQGTGSLIYFILVGIYVVMNIAVFFLTRVAGFIIRDEFVLLGITVVLLYLVAVLTVILCLWLASKRVEGMEI